MNRKILIVDDDELILESVETALEIKDYEVITAANGKLALDAFRKNPVPVVITDIQMPVSDGFELIKNLLLFENKPVIIVQSIASDMSLIIELMQKGVYDYLLKPFNFSELSLRVEKAYEAAEFRILKENLEKERQVRISHMLNWNEWKENILKRDQDKVDGNLIGSIRTSFSQGTGLGSLLSAINRIEKKAIEKENCYEVGKPMMQFLFENAKNAMRIIEVLEEIDTIQSTEIPFSEYSISDLHNLIDSMVIYTQKFEGKKQTIVMCDNKFEHYPHRIRVNPEYFGKAVKELLFNALKFSISHSKIYIIMEVRINAIFVSILSSPDRDGSDVYGISPEYSNIIFDPFFRISKLVFENFPTLDFGLGLAMVDKVIRKHNGKIKAGNLLSYLSQDNTGMPGTLVSFEIELPIY